MGVRGRGAACREAIGIIRGYLTCDTHPQSGHHHHQSRLAGLLATYLSHAADGSRTQTGHDRGVGGRAQPVGEGSPGHGEQLVARVQDVGVLRVEEGAAGGDPLLPAVTQDATVGVAPASRPCVW